MLYAIICEDASDSLPLRAANRPAHIARLQDLVAANRVALAGPFPATDSNDPGSAGFTGSLIVAEFDSLEEARTWAQEDPYVSGGVFRNVVVKPFKQVLP